MSLSVYSLRPPSLKAEGESSPFPVVILQCPHGDAHPFRDLADGSYTPEVSPYMVPYRTS